jgi:hypothetical protein
MMPLHCTVVINKESSSSSDSRFLLNKLMMIKGKPNNPCTLVSDSTVAVGKRGQKPCMLKVSTNLSSTHHRICTQHGPQLAGLRR